MFDFKKNPKSGQCHVKWCTRNSLKDRRLCAKHRHIKVKHDDPLRYHFYALRSNASRRGKDFDLTLDEFKAFCESTGYLDTKGRSRNKMSIDRIDPRLGYSLDNIQCITVSENSYKANLDKGLLNEDLPF